MPDIKDISSVSISDPVALQLTDQLQQLIAQTIQDDGPLPFDRFMEMALYAPGLGYYTAGSEKIGAAGDFITAPEISFIFSHCVARQCQQVLEQTGGSILEFGAGSGIMAAHILDYLDKQNCLPESYLILDLSPDLKQRQQQTIENIVPHLINKVKWLTQLPEVIDGVVLGNEVLDAMPVSVFRKHRGQVEEQYVIGQKDELKVAWQPASALLQKAVNGIESDTGILPEGYLSEVNLRLAGWLASVSGALRKGLLLLIDYGYSRLEYYRPDRSMGTLICHYQHRAHDDPLKLVGLQDITANVDFSGVKNAAEQVGFTMAGYTPQANFLMSLGIEELLAPYINVDQQDFIKLSQAVKVLMLPSEMGERFKVIGLSKGLDEQARGFSMRDLSDRL